MFHLWRKAATTVGTAVVLGGLVLPGSASAAVPAVQLQVCNTAANDQKFAVVGRNQDQVVSTTPVWIVKTHGCHDIHDWYWATNDTIRIDHKIGESAVVVSYFSIPASAQNGTWQRVVISAFGP